MTAYNDPEGLIDFIVSTLKEDLNDCIAQINSERTDLTVDPFLDSEYFLFFRGRPNTEKIIVIEMEQPETKSNSGNTITKAEVLTTIIIPDQLKGDEDYRRSLRYMEALRRVVGKNAYNFMGEMDVEMMAPFWFQKNQVFPFSIGSGIQISTDL